jgi:hypothetical protein
MSFIQGIHTFIPETNHVSRVYSVAAILCLLFMVHTTLSSILNCFIIIIIIISFMQGIHTYVPETNHASRVCDVAATLRILLMVHVTLSSILNSFVLLH